MPTATLAIVLSPDGRPPTEFRLFTPGWNTTKQGRFLFDDQAAKATMAAHAEWGVDIAIDLEHQMFSDKPQPDPTARDARGWCSGLELRNGELWAVGVTWTADGSARLSDKRQRYVSPAFNFDPDTKRVVSLMNVAITSIPATHQTPALVAASARGSMDPKLIKEALDALIAGDEAKCAELLKSLVAAAAGASADPEDAADGGADEAAEGEPPMGAAAGAAAVPPPPPEKKAEVAAASARLMRLTGASSFVDAINVVDTYRTSHIELETERAKLADERKTLEGAERRKGCVELVTLAGRSPANVWSDEKSTVPKSYLSAMPLADFRDYVADAIKAAGGKRPAFAPPAGARLGAAPSGRVDANGLDARELAICREQNCDPAVFAMLKARRSTPVAT